VRYEQRAEGLEGGESGHVCLVDDDDDV
jgi:hypothetical protein